MLKINKILKYFPRILSNTQNCNIVIKLINHRSYTSFFPETKDRFGGITFDFKEIVVSEIEDEVAFKRMFKDRIKQLTDSPKCPVVWVLLPIQLGHHLKFLSDVGFAFHHAEGDSAVLVKWIGQGESKVPMFATHQVGIAALVFREDTKEMLVVKEKHKQYRDWKLPTGIANLGETIMDAAVREVKEETGLLTEFRSLVAIRQQHLHPGAFGRSDLLFCCRLRVEKNCDPDQLVPCPQEISETRWILPRDLQAVSISPLPNFSRRLVVLISEAEKYGWPHIDLYPSKMKSIYKGLDYHLFHRQISNVEH